VSVRAGASDERIRVATPEHLRVRTDAALALRDVALRGHPHSARAVADAGTPAVVSASEELAYVLAQDGSEASWCHQQSQAAVDPTTHRR
jgi:hypothetical protein